MKTQVTISPGGVFVELKAENALEKTLFESFDKADLGKAELSFFSGSDHNYNYGYSYVNTDKATLSIQIPPRE